MSGPLISLIAAHDLGGGIGMGGRIPWHIPADLRRFRALTEGHTVIMGRKTYDSIGRLLPNRTNIIVSRNPAFQPDGATVATDIDAALAAARAVEADEIFVIGGGEIYRQTLALADRLYLTIVEARYAADAMFPPYDAFTTVLEEVWHDDNAPPYRYLTLAR
jgi:dihydrofolate reductase